MKKLLALFAILFAVTICFAQGATLTKEETVNYINKKLSEVVGHKKTSSDGKITATVDSQSISLDDNGKLSYYLSRSWVVSGQNCPNAKLYATSSFIVSHFTSMELAKNYNENEAVGTFKLILLPKTGYEKLVLGAYDRVLMGRCTDWVERTAYENTSDEALFYYLKGDATNFNKIKKAFEYLKDLIKAEDDPFGN